MKLLQLLYIAVKNETKQLLSNYLQLCTSIVIKKVNAILKMVLYKVAIVFVLLIVVINLNFGIIFLINSYTHNNYISWLLMAGLWLIVAIILIMASRKHTVK